MDGLQVLLLLALSLGLLEASRHMQISSDVYCDGPVLRQTAALSGGHCAMKCRTDSQCVAYSQRGSQCYLHAEVCSSDDLLTETGSLYAGKNNNEYLLNDL